jgi:hypothetical protein
MGVVQNIRDRLTNVMSGMGTTADKRVFSFYAFVPMTGARPRPAIARAGWSARSSTSRRST